MYGIAYTNPADLQTSQPRSEADESRARVRASLFRESVMINVSAFNSCRRSRTAEMDGQVTPFGENEDRKRSLDQWQWTVHQSADEKRSATT